MGAPLDLLRRVDLFKQVQQPDLEALAGRFQPRTFGAGSPVASVGSGGLGFYVIAHGDAAVYVHGELRRRLHRADVFGEIALIDGGRRSAEVLAETDLECFAISIKELRPFVKTHAEVAWALLEDLARKLREADAAAKAPARPTGAAPAWRTRWRRR